MLILQPDTVDTEGEGGPKKSPGARCMHLCLCLFNELGVKEFLRADWTACCTDVAQLQSVMLPSRWLSLFKHGSLDVKCQHKWEFQSVTSYFTSWHQIRLELKGKAAAPASWSRLQHGNPHPCDDAMLVNLLLASEMVIWAEETVWKYDQFL